ERLARLVETPSALRDRREVYVGVRMTEARRDRTTVHVTRLVQAPAAKTEVGEILRRQAVAGIEGQRARELPLGRRGIACHRVDAELDLCPDRDPIFRIDRAAGWRRSGRSRCVAEASQALDGIAGLRRTGIAGGGAARGEPAQRLLETCSERRALADA